MTTTPTLADGLHLIVKRDCPTCVLIEPAIAQLAATSQPLTVYSQDDPSFPEAVDAVDDGNLFVSWHHQIETVPTLLRIEAGMRDRAESSAGNGRNGRPSPTSKILRPRLLGTPQVVGRSR